jgi:hypothetical protein
MPILDDGSKPLPSPKPLSRGPALWSDAVRLVLNGFEVWQGAADAEALQSWIDVGLFYAVPGICTVIRRLSALFIG